MAVVKLSTTLIIIIAVSGLVGSVLILFLIFKCCRRPKSAPLPPIQPLAHHREKESPYLPRPRTFHSSLGPNLFGTYESDTSLLKPSRDSTFQASEESNGSPFSTIRSFSAPPSPKTHLTPQSSPATTEDERSSATLQYIPTSRQARSASRVGPRRPRSRVISTASTQTTFTHVSARPVSVIRGAPHSSLSNIQIVLPAPLAPQLQNYMVTIPSIAGTFSNSELDLSIPDIPRSQKTSMSSGHRPSRSSDAVDRSKPSESQAQFRGRSTSHRSIQPHLSSHGDSVPPLPPLDNQARPPKATS